MENIAKDILDEQDIVAKMEIVYVLSNTLHFTFDKSAILKTVIASLFMDTMNIEIDKNLICSAMLMASCKKGDNPQANGRIKTFAIESANYCYLLRFDKKFCTLVEQVNRYANDGPRLPESDIMELSDQYGGMLKDRSERIGFQPDEALVLIEHRNLKDCENKYKELFKVFVEQIEVVDTSKYFSNSISNHLVELYRESQTVKDYIIAVSDNYLNIAYELLEPIKKTNSHKLVDGKKPNRSMFAQDLTYKCMSKVDTNDMDLKDSKF